LSSFNPFSRFGKSKTANSLEKEIQKQLENKPESMTLSKDLVNVEYKVASCCKPLPGDNVVGFLRADDTIEIHRTTCKKASNLMATYGKNIVKAKWREEGSPQFLAGISFMGHDKFGLIREITELLTSQMGINIRSFSLSTHEDIFQGTAMLYVQDSKQLEDIIKKLKTISGIKNVNRI